MSNSEKLARMANAIRFLAADAVQQANSGHPGLPMGAADLATILFSNHLKFDPSKPDWADRDRFVLSAGHGSMLLYSLLYLLGYEDISLDEIKNFRQLDAKTAGHPEFGHAAGIETTTGPLGQGIANALGMAIAERKLNAEFGDALVDHHTWCLAGDGCLMEGISQEAISLAGHLKLNKLIVIWDDNRISIDGPVSLADSTNQIARFEACNWKTISIDGHDHEEIDAAFTEAKTSDRPVLIAARTTIGFGAPNKAGTAGAHGAPLGEDEIGQTRKALKWPYAPFTVPSDILDDWRIAGLNAAQKCKQWTKNLKSADAEIAGEFKRRMRGDLPGGFESAMASLKKDLVKQKPNLATRQASQLVLETINQAIPETLGGSADLTGSNLTCTSQIEAITPEDFNGRYVHWGIREHAMAAAMNGIVLHGGLIPYGGGFLIFSDYCRPSLRLAALMGLRVTHVFTHDSIGLGEDGPTHQPIEHLASLRAMPNFLVLRPCDAVETAECWQVSLETNRSPSGLALSRQALPPLRTETSEENKCALGAYEISSAPEAAQVSIFASGSEVSIAIEAQELLAEEGIAARVVSVPCFELFAAQSDEYQDAILGECTINVAVEAGIRQGWDRFIGRDGLFIGMSSFGASAPASDLYQHFGITAQAIVQSVEQALAA